MSSEMVLARDDVGAKLMWAQEMARGSLLPKQYQNNVPNILYAIELGDALGIPRITAMNQVHVIEGKPSASANLISALVRRAGHRLRVVANDKEATAMITRGDDPDFEYKATWTMARATQAGLAGKAVWKNYPAAMLKSRAITECARMACEEALNGVCYTPEELGATVDATGAVVDVQATADRWSDLDRKIFCAKVNELGFNYDDVAAWCETIDRPRPSNMTPSQRDKCLASIQPGGKMRGEFEAYLSLDARSASVRLADPEAAPLPDSQVERPSEGKPVCPKCGQTGGEIDRALGECSLCGGL